MKLLPIKCIIFLLAGFSFFSSCRKDLKLQPIHIIPEPVSVQALHLSPFVIDDHSIIYITDSSMMLPAQLLLTTLGGGYKIRMIDRTLSTHSGISLRHSTDTSIRDQGYNLDIHTQSIVISAHDTPGLWHGVQSLRQLLPADPAEISTASLPSLVINDYPRFGWRGMHLDVSRHFMPVPFIKKYIDMLSFHKLNVFHWHLVDGIGWRIEIKSHPELTEVGAWRVVKEDKKPWEDFEVWRSGDPRPKYGGFYTQEDIREVVAYATQKGITVLPEIELPGHSEVVFECYPELRCIDEKGDYLPNIGVYCANLQASYDILEDVLVEVMDLFPSEYIHIGGDEVNKSNWTQCVRDKKLMEREHYTPEEVQSHFVNHFDRFLRDHDRKMMGWHEILEGNLSPSAAIMYWGNGRADDVDEMLREGHESVLTPGNIYYFDHYQSTSKHEPPAFGGLSTLTQVYEYESYPAAIEDTYGNQVLGIQANCWTEYMDHSDQVEYMVFPRIAALAESAWSPRHKKDWSVFTQKIPRLLDFYNHQDIQYAPSSFRPLINVSLDHQSNELYVHLDPELPSDLYYSMDQSAPTPAKGIPYAGPFPLSETTTIRAGAYQNEKEIVKPEVKKVIVHKALGKEVVLGTRPYSSYMADGPQTLVDGQFGGDNWGNGRWLGLLNKNVDAEIHFNSSSSIRSIGYSAIEDQGSGIYFPEQIRVSVSVDGEHYTEIATADIDNDAIQYSSKTRDSIFTIAFPPQETKYLKVEAALPRIPDKGMFLFVDEIIVQ